MTRSRGLIAAAAVAALVAAGIAAALVLGGRSSDEADADEPRIVQPGAPGEEARELSEGDEIALMERWLTERGEDVPTDHTDHEMMPGMLTDEQFRELDLARDAAFDRLFLERMITHHQGALQMVDDLYRTGGGIEPAADRFARDAAADQNIEIRRMQELLGSLP
jgi:predicted outer membrane protein